MQNRRYSYVRGLSTATPWILAIAAICAFLLRPDTSAQRVTMNPGRYQLFSATYDAAIDGKAVEYRGVFRVDSETGSVSLYQQGINEKGQNVRYWIAVPDAR
jgi:hypothetical protein